MTFHQWLASSDQTPFTYHVGYLPTDRVSLRLMDDGRLHHFRLEPVHTVAATALKAAETGRIALVQRKRSFGEYEYIAQRAHRH